MIKKVPRVELPNFEEMISEHGDRLNSKLDEMNQESNENNLKNAEDIKNVKEALDIQEEKYID